MTTLASQITQTRNAISQMPKAEADVCLDLSETLLRLTAYYKSTIGHCALELALLEHRLANEENV